MIKTVMGEAAELLNTAIKILKLHLQSHLSAYEIHATFNIRKFRKKNVLLIFLDVFSEKKIAFKNWND